MFRTHRSLIIPEVTMGFFDKVKAGLTKTRNVIAAKLDAIVKVFRPVDEDLLDELEEALILSDLGVDTATEAVERLRGQVKAGRLKEASQVREALAGQPIRAATTRPYGCSIKYKT